MLSKSQIKLITSLEQKKSRSKNGLFIVEGKKGINEFLNSQYRLHILYAIEEFEGADPAKVVLITEGELKKISFLKTPQTGLAIFQIPPSVKPSLKGLVVALDGVRDPGNLGTIIRLCDWFGIENLLCSGDTVDCYNPKVVQASMGSLTRTAVTYCDLEVVLKETNLPVIGTYLNGSNVYTTKLPEEGVLILGNEANGISPEIGKMVLTRLNIPQFGKVKNTESLNVATATAVLLSEFRRQENY